MPIPTVDEFKDMLATRPLTDLAEYLLFEAEVFAFTGKPAAIPSLKRHLTSRLHIHGDSILIVGSAKFGYSLSPDSYFRAFHPKSDIDVVVIDAELFDEINMSVLSWYYPRHWNRLDYVNYNWAVSRMKDAYLGWMSPSNIRYQGLSFPSELKRMRDLSESWFGAFQSLSLYPAFVGRKVNGRLYRTREQALRYHMEGLKILKAVAV